MLALGRITWQRMSTIFAAGLRDTSCEDHTELHTDCPFCRDTAAVQVYEEKVSGESALTWQAVATILADRFQHFAECSAHNKSSEDPDNCPFCRDELVWRKYLEFCGRQGVHAVRRDADYLAESTVAVSIFDIRAAPPGTWPEHFTATTPTTPPAPNQG